MQIFIRIYILLYKIHKKLVEWICFALGYSRLISEAFWMSVLPLSFITAIDEYHYSKSKKYLKEDFNRSLLFDWEKEMVELYFTNCKTIMVLASGGGREVLSLLKMGFKADGYECNRKLVEVSRGLIIKEGYESNIEWVAPNHAPLNGKMYDGIILGWGAYIHVRGKENRIKLLKEIQTHMPQGAYLLISFWFSNEQMDKYCRKLVKVNGFFCKIFRTKVIQKGDRLSPFSGHYFTLEEVSEELQSAGFEVIHQEAYPYGHSVAQKVVL
ncbi:MAG: hypothetical protein PHT69_12090 [Bacteroidales bacterium]|nr:hypothetical protein [Bacteroidales bacterium]